MTEPVAQDATDSAPATVVFGLTITAEAEVVPGDAQDEES